MYLFDRRNVHDVWPFYGAAVDRGRHHNCVCWGSRPASDLHVSAGWMDLTLLLCGFATRCERLLPTH